jgi:hypothetical protein
VRGGRQPLVILLVLLLTSAWIAMLGGTARQMLALLNSSVELAEQSNGDLRRPLVRLNARDRSRQPPEHLTARQGAADAPKEALPVVATDGLGAAEIARLLADPLRETDPEAAAEILGDFDRATAGPLPGH